MSAPDTAGTPPSSAADRAHAHLRAALLAGDLAPGTMLSESALAAELGVSRTPVRTALSRLQDDGLVVIYPKRGALVRELGPDEIRECAQLRHALETAGVQFAAPAARARLRARLTPNLRAQQQALTDGDPAAFARTAIDFHRSFAELAGNALMLDYYDRLRDRQLLAIVASRPTLSGDPQQVLDEHRRLLDAAEDGDWVEFARQLRNHQEERARLP
ncbi:putative GntR family transcriptional regulator [Gordonia hirsuta DSM 44140 = NBRC 16056]|uniref:Putative GntR family transcriptional regulator n=1 Tax=Gordonia hirsuta DSM 44140 = NBRC 16056 TaxID=1121927 RepID=L7L5E9_9ACTN|nr:GntR family transcriptional regulator [Gordonia hirsuta]GAC56164.1 putative GntR family transcriptional regulator [Gordonia hirsuta DSM 44140 = NBRC 16056]